MSSASTKILQRIQFESLRVGIAALHHARIYRIVSAALMLVYLFRSLLSFAFGEPRIVSIMFGASLALLVLNLLGQSHRRLTLLSSLVTILVIGVEAGLVYIGYTHVTQFILVVPVCITFLALMAGMLPTIILSAGVALIGFFLIHLSLDRGDFFALISKELNFRYRFLLYLVGTELLLVLILHLFHDILAKSDQDLEISRENESRATRRSAVAETLGKAAHELNNPLAIADGAFRRLLHHQETQDVELQQRNIQHMQASIVRLKEVLESIRVFVEGDLEESFKSVPVEVLVNQFLIGTREKVKSFGVKFSAQNLVPHRSRVFCRPAQVQYVLQVLFDNAVDAMAKGEKRLRFQVRMRSDMVRFELEDNGRGILPIDVEKIFNPFFSTKSIGKSIGMNLSISRVLIQEQGGSIGFEGLDEGGTRFYFELPLLMTNDEAAHG